MKLHLSVAEPWDFDGPDGPNMLDVEITKTGKGRYGDWAVCISKEFRIGNTAVTSLLLLPRHSGKDSFLKEIEKGVRVAANAYWRKSGKEWDDKSIFAAELDNTEIGGWLIVTIMKRA